MNGRSDSALVAVAPAAASWTTLNVVPQVLDARAVNSKILQAELVRATHALGSPQIVALNEDYDDKFNCYENYGDYMDYGYDNYGDYLDYNDYDNYLDYSDSD